MSVSPLAAWTALRYGVTQGGRGKVSSVQQDSDEPGLASGGHSGTNLSVLPGKTTAVTATSPFVTVFPCDAVWLSCSAFLLVFSIRSSPRLPNSQLWIQQRCSGNTKAVLASSACFASPPNLEPWLIYLTLNRNPLTNQFSSAQVQHQFPHFLVSVHFHFYANLTFHCSLITSSSLLQISCSVIYSPAFRCCLRPKPPQKCFSDSARFWLALKHYLSQSCTRNGHSNTWAHCFRR